MSTELEIQYALMAGASYISTRARKKKGVSSNIPTFPAIILDSKNGGGASFRLSLS